MKKDNVLILSMGDISNDPRPYRMAECLKDTYSLTILTKKLENLTSDIQDIDYIVHNMGNESKQIRILNILKNQFRLFEASLWTKEMHRVKDELLENNFKYIICHNVTLLPLAINIKKNAKILFDAREYYPKHFEDKLLWKIMYQGLNKYLCYKYMPQVNYTITVSNGIMEKYNDDLNIDNISVIESLPDYHELKPVEVDDKMIRIIHHGNATTSRRIEDMIYMMDYADAKFELTLMLMPTDKKYYNHIQGLCNARKNVKIISPVKYKDIISTINQYDIGIFNAYPTTFNLKHTLPNKFFEFIQARLSVMVGPSIEMTRLIDKYNLGVYSIDFTPKEMAYTLNTLTIDNINKFKSNANEVAKILNKDKNCIKIKQIIGDL